MRPSPRSRKTASRMWRTRPAPHRTAPRKGRARSPVAPTLARSGPMLELLLCSLLTVFPDYLYRRYVQGKRLGKEITLYSVWFELRWGIVACLMLTVGLITVIFYNHPSTTNATLVHAAERGDPIAGV